MALKVDIWPPLPLETQTKCHLHGSLSGVSNAPPFCGNQKPPAWPPKTVLLVKKRRPTCPLWFKGPAKWTPTWAYVCTKTPLHEKVLHSSKYPPKLLHRSHECHEYPPLFLAKFAAKKAKRAPRAPLKSRAVIFRRRVFPETGRRWGNPYYFSVRNSVFISCVPFPPFSSLVLKNNHSSLCIENRRFTINRSNFISYFGGHP